MANSKKGFTFFALDCDFTQDSRLVKLRHQTQFRGYGINIYIKLLCEAYREHGCYVEWDESTAYEMAEHFCCKSSLVNEVINYLCSIGLFDRELWANKEVLTSKSIQSRYALMWRKSRRKAEYFKIPESICLLSQSEIDELLYQLDREQSDEDEQENQNAGSLNKNAVSLPQNAVSLDENVVSLKQRKEKKRKEEFLNIINNIPFFSEEKVLLKFKKMENVEFRELTRLWLGYKETTAEKIRKDSAVQSIYTRLCKTYDDNPNFAEFGIEKSIYHGYPGFFPLNEKEKSAILKNVKNTEPPNELANQEDTQSQPPENEAIVKIDINDIARNITIGSKVKILPQEIEFFEEILFFEKRIKYPKLEARRFVDYYDAVNWTLQSRKPVTDRANFLRRAWKSDNVEKFPINYGNFLRCLQQVYKVAKSAHLPDYHCITTDFIDYTENNTDIIIQCNEKLYNLMENNDILLPAIEKLSGNKDLIYKLPK